ncbi:TPA: tautomerase family protein [Bacillus thuringiensis]|uniref:4-oxalocrotonate tautomerase n=8 Tax=Bacillaceae TaxID=186817 RepID=A0A643MA16_BACTU|nr:4-oxalocrotonate tautomerase [Bacillus thuringiensis serovar kurstaki str. HD73]AHZ50811.1 putative tautomerase YusQ [Bacillus thuringiensis serovar kurstaki str. YBT-1520]AIE33209.1 putative tautomerase YusQ [Bacillus thuringiensis serovar kurstaki str. HD-1]AJK41764.1 carboxymuconolactone decarboxylase family protein [Bacillus thuringiensis serovar kurstaki]EEL56595.1 4-oxalocrotonate tautomerase [Bacillus cereus Rock4-2]EEM53865.1 4-oxalocrotonate tautomerase [Bacillus thuringiensis sero
MPFVKIYYPENILNEEELEKMGECIHLSLIEHFNIPENDYFQMFLPYQENKFLYNPYYLLERGEKRTENMIYVSITCGPGRTVQQKKDLYQSVSLKITEYSDVKTSDIFITLNETAAENWSFGQGIAQMVKIKGEKNELIEVHIKKKMREMSPAFAHYSEKILFEEVWRDATLTLRERSLCTVSALISLGNTEQLQFHLKLAKQNGVMENELVALITHMAFYVGWPKAMAALNIVMNERQS